MNTPDDQPTRRREFLGQIAASAIVLAGAACTTPLATGQATATPTPSPGPATPPAPTQWDDSWFGRLTAKHKAVFDSPDIAYGEAVGQATRYIWGMRAAVAAGEKDVQAVVVIRHGAIPLAFNDAMWAKYQLGKVFKIKDDSKKWATRNPWATDAQDSKATDNLAWLASHGHVLLGCNLAMLGQAWLIAKRTKGNADVVYEELKANLVPGVILQPNGVYAVHRAQEAGCTYIRVS